MIFRGAERRSGQLLPVFGGWMCNKSCAGQFDLLSVLKFAFALLENSTCRHQIVNLWLTDKRMLPNMLAAMCVLLLLSTRTNMQETVEIFVIHGISFNVDFACLSATCIMLFDVACIAHIPSIILKCPERIVSSDLIQQN